MLFCFNWPLTEKQLKKQKFGRFVPTIKFHIIRCKKSRCCRYSKILKFFMCSISQVLSRSVRVVLNDDVILYGTGTNLYTFSIGFITERRFQTFDMRKLDLSGSGSGGEQLPTAIVRIERDVEQAIRLTSMYKMQKKKKK